MSSVNKPQPPVKPTKIQEEFKSSIVTNPMPSVMELRKNLEKTLKFQAGGKKKVIMSVSVDAPLPSTPVVHHTPWKSRCNTICSGQGKKYPVNPSDKTVELDQLSLHNKGTSRVTPQDSTLISPSSVGSVDVVEKEANRKNMKQIAEMMDKDCHNSESKNDLEDVWVYSPVSMLMKQILDSVEMPLVHFNALPETELVQLLSLYNEDIDRARIHCISEWNDTVNRLLERTGYSSSDFYRNIASLILCKVDLDDKVASKCLGNDRVKLIITGHVSKLEQSGQLVNSSPAHHHDNKNSRMNPDILHRIIEEVMTFGWGECAVEQQCQICFEKFPSDKIFGMSLCQCVVCNPCMQRYFAIMIHDGYVANFVCPVCHLPDVEDVDEDSLHFQLLEPKLKSLLSEEDFQTYQRKMTEWNLMKNPNFLWCINATCRSGFVIEENGYSRVVCPECRLEMCHKCRKPWVEQHVGLTCERFKAWKDSNDPEYQETGLKRQLQENGIGCPRCKRRYLLSKGGCIHFTCTFCHFEFCSSCSRPFVRSCKRSNHCQQSGGLHCHHPRNCLYYLRDRSVVELQRLLESNNVSYEMHYESPATTCQVVEEQDTDTEVTRESVCNAESFLPGHDGYCEKHYKEYLARIIQKNRIDPAAVMSQSELIRELQNSGITNITEQLKTETEDQYRSRLRQLVMVNAVLP